MRGAERSEGFAGYPGCHCGNGGHGAFSAHEEAFREDFAMLDTLRHMQARLNDSAHLGRLGRLFCETVLIEVDGAEYYLTFRDGRL
jgi:hypothetical protein